MHSALFCFPKICSSLLCCTNSQAAWKHTVLHITLSTKYLNKMWATQEQKMVKWHQKHSVNHLALKPPPIPQMFSASIALFSIAAPAYIPRYIYPCSLPCTNTRLNCCPPVLTRRTMLLFFDDDLLVWPCACLYLLPNPLVIPPKDNFPSSCSGVLGNQLAVEAPLNQSCRRMK